jgi:hypothetical protein
MRSSTASLLMKEAKELHEKAAHSQSYSHEEDDEVDLD